MPSRLVLISLIFGVAAGCGGSLDTRDPVWGYISPAIIQPNCATSSCHSEGAAVSGLNLSHVDDGFISLRRLMIPPVGGGTTAPSARPLVIPNNPDQSRLVWMLRGIGADRMPPDRPLAEADIVLIERWILNGAEND